MLELLSKGGFLMYPIFLCSVVSVAIILERVTQLRKASRGADRLEREVRDAVASGDLTEAIHVCERSGHPLSGVVLAGLSHVSGGEAEVRRAIEGAGETETNRLERNVAVLATIVGGAPLLGFLGTVLGMIQAFQSIEKLGGNVDASVLAGGIWEALLTTAAGLSVGVFTYFAHNIIVGRIQAITHQMEMASERVIESLFTRDAAHGTGAHDPEATRRRAHGTVR